MRQLCSAFRAPDQFLGCGGEAVLAGGGDGVGVRIPTAPRSTNTTLGLIATMFSFCGSGRSNPGASTGVVDLHADPVAEEANAGGPAHEVVLQPGVGGDPLGEAE